MANEKQMIDKNALLEWFRAYTHEDILLEPVDVISEIRSFPTVDAVVLPCKVGDTLYVITQTRDKRILPFINQYEATNIKVGKRKCVVYHEQDGFMKVFKQDDFGKTVFLTREEAEAALTERRNRGEQKAAD